MAERISRDFSETVIERAKTDADFNLALIEGAIELCAAGETGAVMVLLTDLLACYTAERVAKRDAETAHDSSQKFR